MKFFLVHNKLLFTDYTGVNFQVLTNIVLSYFKRLLEYLRSDSFWCWSFRKIKVIYTQFVAIAYMMWKLPKSLQRINVIMYLHCWYYIWYQNLHQYLQDCDLLSKWFHLHKKKEYINSFVKNCTILVLTVSFKWVFTDYWFHQIFVEISWT